MTKKERLIVFTTGLILLTIFTFTDLQISNVIYTKNWYGRFFEIIGELPFEFLALLGSLLLFRFRSKKNRFINVLTGILTILLAVLFLFMAGYMTLMYLEDNAIILPSYFAYLIAGIMLLIAVVVAKQVSEDKAQQAVTYGIIAIVYIILVIVVMNSLKTVWGRMRLREMTDPLQEFTRWYKITSRGGFDNVYASFPSGHSMNSAAIILLILLPSFLPKLQDKTKLLKFIAYGWALIVGSSRIVMGAHFASDVTVGILLSFALFDITYLIVKKFRKNALSI